MSGPSARERHVDAGRRLAGAERLARALRGEAQLGDRCGRTSQVVGVVDARSARRVAAASASRSHGSSASSALRRRGRPYGCHVPIANQRFTVLRLQPSSAAIRFVPQPSPRNRRIVSTSSGVCTSPHEPPARRVRDLLLHSLPSSRRGQFSCRHEVSFRCRPTGGNPPCFTTEGSDSSLLVANGASSDLGGAAFLVRVALATSQQTLVETFSNQQTSEALFSGAGLVASINPTGLVLLDPLLGPTAIAPGVGGQFAPLRDGTYAIGGNPDVIRVAPQTAPGQRSRARRRSARRTLGARCDGSTPKAVDSLIETTLPADPAAACSPSCRMPKPRTCESGSGSGEPAKWPDWWPGVKDPSEPRTRDTPAGCRR